jgi:hypothetical protein
MSKEAIIALGAAGVVCASAITAYMMHKHPHQDYLGLGFWSISSISIMTILAIPDF